MEGAKNNNPHSSVDKLKHFSARIAGEKGY